VSAARVFWSCIAVRTERHKGTSDPAHRRFEKHVNAGAVGDVVGNSSIVQIGTWGKACLYASQGTDLLMDTTEYFDRKTLHWSRVR
jgi:hypothetical protein